MPTAAFLTICRTFAEDERSAPSVGALRVAAAAEHAAEGQLPRRVLDLVREYDEDARDLDSLRSSVRVLL